MKDNNILILKGSDVAALLAGQENELIGTVRMAYVAHARDHTSLPHSTFLRFPDDERNRIIALPAYLGEDFNVSGIKWVSSFPGNLSMKIDRASAVVVLNSMLTGRPEAIIEGSIISAKRTAASAALAAKTLQDGNFAARVGTIGCGLINFEITRFLLAACPGIESFLIFDLDAERAKQFKSKCERTFSEIDFNVAEDVNEVLRGCSLISLATTAIKPHIADPSAIRPGSTILHISLRDFSPEAILSSDNVVDDVDHVCRAQTSVHLAEQLVGNRDFIRCALADVVLGTAPARINGESPVIFSPFGLGILDMGVAKLVRDMAITKGVGTYIDSFLPESWTMG